VRFTWLLALAVLASGCYERHGASGLAPPAPVDAGGLGRDAGPPARDADPAPGRDAGPRDPDAGPRRDGDYWELVERPDAFLAIPHELGCRVHDGGRVVVAVRTPVDTVCDHGGPVEAEQADDGTWIIRAYLWRHHRRDPDECLGITAIEERHLVLEAVGGSFRAEVASGSSAVTLDVAPPAPDSPPCSGAGAPGARCIRDCECAGDLVCVPEAGDFVMCDGGRCAEPCDPQGGTNPPIYGRHLDCESVEACRTRDGLAAPTCGPITDDGCFRDPAACGPGTLCPPTGVVSECTWELELRGSNRHACGSDADCDPGLYCVEHADDARRCDVPCFTQGMRCPFMHECRRPDWVCEWIGE